LARRQVQVGGDVAGVWHHAALVRDKDAQTVSLYYQGEFKTSLSSVVGHTVTATQIDIGAANGGAQFNGSIDETRISLTARSAAWLVTEFNNQNDPVSFAVSSGEEMFTPTGTLIMVR
jgi:hypothetical protein